MASIFSVGAVREDQNGLMEVEGMRTRPIWSWEKESESEPDLMNETIESQAADEDGMQVEDNEEMEIDEYPPPYEVWDPLKTDLCNLQLCFFQNEFHPLSFHRLELK